MTENTSLTTCLFHLSKCTSTHVFPTCLFPKGRQNTDSQTFSTFGHNIDWFGENLFAKTEGNISMQTWNNEQKLNIMFSLVVLLIEESFKIFSYSQQLRFALNFYQSFIFEIFGFLKCFICANSAIILEIHNN